MAKRVLSIRRFRSLAAISNLWPNSPAARSGKSSGASVCRAKRDWPERERQALLLGVARHLDLGAVGQLAHDVVQHVGRHGHRAGLETSAGASSDTSRSRSVALNCSAPLGGLEQHVRQDRDGRAPLDHARDVAKGSQKLTAFDHQLHALPRRLLPAVRRTCAVLGARPCRRAFAKSRKPRNCSRRFARLGKVDRDAVRLQGPRARQFRGSRSCTPKRCRSGACDAAPPRRIRPPRDPLADGFGARLPGRRI